MSKAPQTLTVTEQHQLLDRLIWHTIDGAGFKNSVRNYALACFQLEAGLRVGELVLLRKDDLFYLDKPLKMLLIRSEIAKRGHERLVPISSRLAHAIVSLKKYVWNASDPGLTNYAFCASKTGKHITTRQVERIIKKAGMSGIGRPINPHVLRHTFASKLMRVTDMRTVQELLGHKNLSSTQVYTHPNNDDKQKAIDNLEAGQ